MIDFLKFANQDDADKYNMLLETEAEIHQLKQENQSLKDRIDKAINVLEKLQDWNYYDGLTCEQIREPLEILKGSDK